MTTSIRIQKALQELDFMEEVLRIDETPDFVEVVGGQGGDVARYRVYFDHLDNVTHVGVK